MNTKINKFLYGSFVFFGIYLPAFKHEFGNAGMYFGIALAFDPFDTAQPWNKRPVWQKVVLIVHLVITFGLFGYGVGFNDK